MSHPGLVVAEGIDLEDADPFLPHLDQFLQGVVGNYDGDAVNKCDFARDQEAKGGVVGNICHLLTSQEFLRVAWGAGIKRTQD